jgi:hypothetical protein
MLGRMLPEDRGLADLDNWPILLSFLPAGWQVELAFKRMKSILGFGHLPKKDPASARAWLRGKLFVSLLAEHLIAVAGMRSLVCSRIQSAVDFDSQFRCDQ